MSTLADRLKEARERAGLGTRSLSRLSGVSPGQISKLESGERGDRVEAGTIQKLAQALKVSESWLLGKEVDDVPVVRKQAADPRIDRWIDGGLLPSWIAEAAVASAGGFARYTEEQLWDYCESIVQAARRRLPPLPDEDEKPKRRGR